MKTPILTLVTLAILGLSTANAQIGIGTTEPDQSAELDVTSPGSDKGFLPPRMTTSERNDIANPAEGLTIYNTDTNCIEFFDNTLWISICNGNPSFPVSASLCDNDVSTGTGDIVLMKYNYTGEFGVADYDWCAREITQTMENAAFPSDPAPLGGKVWLDRNLGAYRVPNNRNDLAGHGDLYQWGRPNIDGHAKIYQQSNDPAEFKPTVTGPVVPGEPATPGFTDTKSDFPPNSEFIRAIDVNAPSGYSWTASDPNGVGPFPGGDITHFWNEAGTGINNPCPSGFRIPTRTEYVLLRDWLRNSGSASTKDYVYDETLLKFPTSQARGGGGSNPLHPDLFNPASGHGETWILGLNDPVRQSFHVRTSTYRFGPITGGLTVARAYYFRVVADRAFVDEGNGGIVDGYAVRCLRD